MKFCVLHLVLGSRWLIPSLLTIRRSQVQHDDKYGATLIRPQANVFTLNADEIYIYSIPMCFMLMRIIINTNHYKFLTLNTWFRRFIT